MKSGKLRKRFWQDWRRSSKETVWQIAVTPDTYEAPECGVDILDFGKIAL